VSTAETRRIANNDNNKSVADIESKVEIPVQNKAIEHKLIVPRS
jgi:hypothetical protein